MSEDVTEIEMDPEMAKAVVETMSTDLDSLMAKIREIRYCYHCDNVLLYQR